VCDLETPRIGAPYIYNVRLLRVNMDIREVACGGMDWIDLLQDMKRWRALVNAVMNLRVS
jgi:hypothetical protein